jgi:hypothetical protein
MKSLKVGACVEAAGTGGAIVSVMRRRIGNRSRRDDATMLRGIRALALLGTMLFSSLVAACGMPVALRTAPAKVDACDLALLAGELIASTKSGLAVRNADTVTEVVWPFGYSAARETTGLVLRDDKGKVVAHEGQRVTLGGGGGGGADGAWVACAGSVQEVSDTGG